MWGLYSCCLSSRAYYIVVVPLKKQRTGKFLKPWDDPDEMNLEEVRQKKKEKIFLCFPSVLEKLGRKLIWGSYEGRGNKR